VNLLLLQEKEIFHFSFEIFHWSFKTSVLDFLSRPDFSVRFVVFNKK